MNIVIKLHFPHDRFILGWDVIYRDEEYDTTIISLYFLIITLELEF